MADVSVEFGAKDTGLEQTLKTVQAQLTSLEEEVKSGTLSFDELQQTMRKIGQAEKVQAQLQGMAASMSEAGNAASTAEPKLDALGNEAADMGNKVQGAGQKTDDSAGLFDAGFNKIAAAFTVGNLAAKGFEAIINGVFSAARAVVDSFGQALDLGGRLNDLSQRTGESAGNLLVLENAFKNSGLAADQVGQVINKLQNFMQDAANGGEKQTATMNRLGISMQDLAGKTPTRQMEIFAQKISEISDPTQRAATASDVFGEKLGGKLLPLLSEFAPTLEDSRDKVGSLADVMDENAATFDAAGETIDAVKGKLTAFAAGILSEVIPEIQSLGTSMEEVDAAGLGETIGSALAPALRDLNGLVGEAKLLMDQLSYEEQQLRDDTGTLGVAYDTTQAALATFNNALFDALAYVTPFDASIESLRGTFVGVKAAQDDATTSVNAMGTAVAGVAPTLETSSVSAERFATSLRDIGTGSGQAFSDINNGATTFNSLLDSGNISLSDMSGSISGQSPLITQNISLMEQINTSLGEANVKAGEQLAKIEQQVAAEQARNEKIAERQEKSAADYQLQIQINEALAAGNTTLAEGLQYQREHSQLTEKIMRDTGMSKDEASQLATNFLASRDAAEAAAKSARNLTTNASGAAGEAGRTNENLESVRQTMQDIEGAKMDSAPKALQQRTSDARKELKAMKDFIGEDLSQMSLDNILTKLGLDPGSFQTTDQKINALEGAIKDIGDADPADITPTVDEVGVNDRLETVKGYLAGLGKPDATPTMDQSAVETAVSTAKRTIDDGLTKTPIDVTISAEESIGKIRSELEKQIDLGIQSSEGTKHLSSIDTLVNKIEQLVSKIEGKLPLQALAY